MCWRMADNTIIVCVSDLGDMLGERGLWFKMNVFEGSARVPMMIAAPGWKPGRIDTPVSALDITPTLAGIDISTLARWTDGTDLAPVAQGGARAAVPMEYAAESTIAPMVCLREGRYKLMLCAVDPPLQKASDRDMRNHMDLNVLEENQRFPRGE